MRTTKPVIGVTGPDKGGYTAWLFTKFAVWRAGGKALRITPNTVQTVTNLDGLILGGGADINPGRYGKSIEPEEIMKQKPDKGLLKWFKFIMRALLYPLFFLIRKILSTSEHGVDQNRDELEFPLLEKSLKHNIPILGICRGAQLINVHFGGDLHNSLTNFYTEIPQLYTIWPKKKVHVEKDSRLYDILGKSQLHVNALHLQAVKNVAPDLRPTVKEPNEVIQGIEQKEASFLIGVQWHPEYLPQKKCQQNIFARLVECAAESVTNRD